MIKEIGILIFLAWNSILDIRKKEISPGLTTAFGICGLLRIWISRGDFRSCFAPLLAGAILLGISFLSGNRVGAGDGLLFLALGTVLEAEQFFTVLFWSLLGCGIWSVVLLLFCHGKKEQEIPLVPFVFLVYGGGCLL